MSFENRYGLFDRALHRLAFATPRAQLGLADLEERRFRDELAAVEPGPPVLITALPRAGTTILLELLAALPGFAAHTYRDMPFVLCPLLGHQLVGRRGRGDDARRERAHGDGIEIGLDSPEAFEEMVWMAFHRRRYRGDRLAPWTHCDDPEFAAFFRAHRRKIVALRRRDKPTASRYVAKNNLDVARLPALFEAVPDAQVIVPVREPLQHAASLQRQHLRFLELHRRDPFARRYMAGIGHFDFGANLKPIDFDGWLDRARDAKLEPTELPYWLAYWEAAYRHLRQVADHPQIHLVEFERLAEPATLTALATILDVPADELTERAAMLRPPPPRSIDLPAGAHDLAARCHSLHRDEIRPGTG